MNLSQQYKILQGIVLQIANAPDGVGAGEIAAQYQINRRLVPKYIDILSSAGVPIYMEKRRYFLDDTYFTAFTLTPDESEFLHLILERSLRYHMGHSHILRSLMRKLGSKMNQPLADILVGQIDLDAGISPSDRWFTVLAKAKREHREVWIDYHALHRSQPTRWLVRPFRFASNPLSDGLYLFCQGVVSSGDGDPVALSLKFDRILNVEATAQQFDITQLAQFAEREGKAWSVWSSEREPVSVVLRFEARHYDRLLETVWHPSQQIRVDNTGTVIYSVEVSEPEEMVPWIRSWGSGVEVLEPSELRERLIRSVIRQMQIYGLSVQDQQHDEDVLTFLWAKYNRSNRLYHILHYHLLDAAAVACIMWDQVLSHSQREWLSALLETDEDATRTILALLTGLHDIGKAVPGFQQKAPPVYERLLDAGIPDERGFPDPHGVLSAVILRDLLARYGIHKRSARVIASAVGGHHGEWISRSDLHKARGARGHQAWEDLQARLFDLVAEVLEIKSVTLPHDPEQINRFAVFLSGFVSICDWIASNETYFPYEPKQIEPEPYFNEALQRAQFALSETGWFSWKPEGTMPGFDEVFPFSPNAMQRAALDAIRFDDGPPRLVLVEYLTGGGKTELAQYLADWLINQFALAGMYIAMPTQTTSNQMFDRTLNFIKDRYPNQPINMQLIHAEAQDHPFYVQMSPQTDDRAGNDNAITAETWFQNRKRALLAPFAVGTIDQAMMSVLQARHHFVRQYALSHKVLIGDEIHNYDAYMYTIIERLLVWLNALNAVPILLSATLSQATREQLLAQVGVSRESVADVPYPRLTIVNHSGDVEVHALPAPSTRTLNIQHLNADIGELCDWLAEVYRQGGCIAVVCNTVDEAIQVASALRDHPDFAPEDVLLFHARFPPAWRDQIEGKVLDWFGKDGVRPARAVLVATQIIEQSLDLDFDLMVSSTAPIDLLIQRVGRLHRHDRPRPLHLCEPTLVLRRPLYMEADVPDFGVDAVIYARYIMLKTWLLLHERTVMHIPDEIDTLVNFVYDTGTTLQDVSDVYNAALESAYDEMALGDTGARFRGDTYCIATPDSEELIGESTLDLPDDEQRVIATREIRPGVDVVCVRGDPADQRLPPLPNRPPSRDEIRRLRRFRITVRKASVRDALDALPLHQAWVRNLELQHARPLAFVDGVARIPNSPYTLRLTPYFGLEILEEA